MIIGAVTDKKIGLLLSGLGAMSAVLILVFKDTILGFVAGIQLSSNDMLRVGDWITMPGAGADGDVIDITLYTVKVRNFDRTIVTIPTWKLISESYQNWRGMAESGGRRIKRALLIDAASVHFLDAEQIERLGRFRLLKDYLGSKHTELLEWNRSLGEAGEQLVNRRRLTNLGTFRAYVSAYLGQHPKHPPRDDLHGAPAGRRGAGHSAGALLLHRHHGVGRLRVDPERYLRPPDRAAAGVRAGLFQQPSGQDVRAGLARLARGSGGAIATAPRPRGSDS